ncbi:MAG: LacI family DNA-binding transcriptional regulator, partial [Pelovirga sp.]
VTIKEIAGIAGVSRGTVDRVLNNRGKVNFEVEQRVKEIAKRMNYRPNRAAKALAARKKAASKRTQDRSANVS